MASIRRQVEVARPGAIWGVDFEVVKTVQDVNPKVVDLSGSFDIPTQAELDTANAQADIEDNRMDVNLTQLKTIADVVKANKTVADWAAWVDSMPGATPEARNRQAIARLGFGMGRIVRYLFWRHSEFFDAGE